MSTGEDISIGFAWRASMMANSSRDPYWQAGVRRAIHWLPSGGRSTVEAALERWEAAIAELTGG